MKDKQYCIGCDSDFYNGNNPYGVKECWNFKTAKIVTKFRIGWWTPMDKADRFQKVKTHNCHTESGRFAFLDKMPEHLVSPTGGKIG